MNILPKFIGGAVVVAGLFGLSRIAIPPAHAHHEGVFSHAPDAGYKWEDPDGYFDRTVLWNPGATHPEHPHITAAAEEGHWNADPGYVLNDDGSLNASWQPGSTHPLHPHITAAAQEGSWDPDPGYILDGDGSLSASWKSGLRYPGRPHISSSAKEGDWTPDDGYVFTFPGNPAELDVVWSAGKPSVIYPHVKAATAPDGWVPFPGYDWVHYNVTMEVVWRPTLPNSEVEHVKAGMQENTWYADPGYHIAKNDAGRMFAEPDGTYHSTYAYNTPTLPSSSSYPSPTSSSSPNKPSIVGWAFHKIIKNQADDCASDENRWAITRLACSAISDDQEKKADDDWYGRH